MSDTSSPQHIPEPAVDDAASARAATTGDVAARDDHAGADAHPASDRSSTSTLETSDAAAKGDAVAHGVRVGSLTKRERRGAILGGIVGLPLVSLGLITLAVPLALWYITTVAKTIFVVFADLLGDRDAAVATNDAIEAVDPTTTSQIAIVLTIVGLVVLIAGFVLSYVLMRTHGVRRAWLVTVTSTPIGVSVALVVTVLVGALGGLIFQRTADSVSTILANGLLGLVGFLVASLVICVIVGAGVWWWMSRTYRATVVSQVVAKDAGTR